LGLGSRGPSMKYCCIGLLDQKKERKKKKIHKTLKFPILGGLTDYLP